MRGSKIIDTPTFKGHNSTKEQICGIPKWIETFPTARAFSNITYGAHRSFNFEPSPGEYSEKSVVLRSNLCLASFKLPCFIILGDSCPISAPPKSSVLRIIIYLIPVHKHQIRLVFSKFSTIRPEIIWIESDRTDRLI